MMDPSTKLSRHEDEQLMIFGIHPVAESADAGRQFEKIFLQRDSKNPSLKTLRNLLDKRAISYVQVPVEKLNRLTRKNHQGVVAFLSLVEYAALDQVVPSLFDDRAHPLVLMLDRVTDVRNFGAICRTAESLKAGAVIIPAQGGALVNGDAMRASAGALGRITLCREPNLKLSIEYLRQSGFLVAACTEKAKLPVYQADLNQPVCLVLGSEEDGISEAYLKRCDIQMQIPLSGKTGSLNVSVAAAIMMYEVRRQQINS